MGDATMLNERVKNDTTVPVCRHLRTKMFYISEALGLRYMEKTMPSESYWCMKTMTATGPDDQPVEPDECGRGRRCREERLESLAFEVTADD